MSRRFRWAIGLLVLVVAFAFVRSFSPLQTGQNDWRLPTGTGTPAVAIGHNHAVILASDGSLWTWGENGFGWQVLGLGSSIRTQACLRRIGLEANWVNIAVCGSTTLALKTDGTIWAWGENLYGQLGDGTMAPDQASPVRSVPGNDWKQVASGGSHSVALRQDGTLWSWGNNAGGQLGDGTTNWSRIPVRVGSSTNWVRIWANLLQNATFAILFQAP
jgi:alpha-tubulin suppressor-like RCC1 family protein